ncbi:hypothetical protein SAMN04489752_2235 [Brevibacterium siliguriense]|uniref:Uncharacterized protein n=1 Tax=Brevibacterium siliguriense TaxID=1136497 RepID=A0A1H1U4X2_9MICO|nr:hypothetical protein [Brevibacterium siliguriense]SDS67474.1 hypothetical protein SAMN04489752_2235 [Brevibacterium siliguriense]
MDLTTDSLLLTLALNHRLRSTLPPDEVTSAFLDDDRDVPLIFSDEVFGSSVPTGLLLFIAEAAAYGITHARLALHHPSLPHTTPPVDRTARTKVGRHTAPVVLHRGDEQAAIALIGAEANVEILACRPTVFRPVTVGTAAEALRRLRLLVMEGLNLIETIDVPRNGGRDRGATGRRSCRRCTRSPGSSPPRRIPERSTPPSTSTTGCAACWPRPRSLRPSSVRCCLSCTLRPRTTSWLWLR